MLPKPEPRRRAKDRRKRLESKIIGIVRAAVMRRDRERCRARGVSSCEGPIEWAHFGSHRRCFTRGMPPELRHTTAGSLAMCKKHHMSYDAHRLEIRPLTEREADGRLEFREDEHVFQE